MSMNATDALPLSASATLSATVDFPDPLPPATPMMSGRGTPAAVASDAEPRLVLMECEETSASRFRIGGLGSCSLCRGATSPEKAHARPYGRQRRGFQRLRSLSRGGRAAARLWLMQRVLPVVLLALLASCAPLPPAFPPAPQPDPEAAPAPTPAPPAEEVAEGPTRLRIISLND